MKKRGLIQFTILILFFVVPLLNIFRIDLVHLYFYLFGKKFSFNDGYILMLTTLILVFTFVSISKWFGRRFCSWMCPHNTFSVYLTKIMNIKSIQNNKTAGRIIDTGISALFAPIIAFSMVAYFYNPKDLIKEILVFDTSAWSFLLYVFMAIFFFVMINRLRFRFCRNACPYGILQHAFSDKDSYDGGIKNMFRGTGLVLTILMTIMVSLLLFTTLTSKDFAVTVGKNLQGVGAQDRIIYSYDLKIDNLKNEPAAFNIRYEDIPSSWERIVPKKVEIQPNSIAKESLLFRIAETNSINNTVITIKIQDEDGKEIEKQISILPVAK